MYFVRAVLRMKTMRLPEQQNRIEAILALPQLRMVKIDITGLGLGLFEYMRERFGIRVAGVDFGTSVAMPSRILAEGRAEEKVRVTEALAVKLLQRFEDRAIQIPVDSDLREELRKPERMTSPTGSVSIAATRNEAGHADQFWSPALAVDRPTEEIHRPRK